MQAAPATTITSLSPPAVKFAVWTGSANKIYDASLTELVTTSTNAGRVRGANSTYVLTGTSATDSSNTTHRLRLVSDLSVVWSVSIPGFFNMVAGYEHCAIDDTNGVYVLENNVDFGTTIRLRKLNISDGSQAWSTTVTTTGLLNDSVFHLLYDPTEDVCVVTGEVGGEGVKLYDGSTGTLIADHKVGLLVADNNKTARYSAISGGYLYVPTTGGDPTRQL